MIEKYHPTRLRFGLFELDLRTSELQKNGQRIRLQHQPARLLSFLARNRGELVTREEIRQALWGDDQFVEFEHAINTAIRKVRDALEDPADHSQLIETVPKQGYRFVAKVDEIYPEDARDDMRATLTHEIQHPPEHITDSIRAPNLSETEMEESFRLPVSSALARRLFLIIQFGFLAMYCAALYYIDALDQGLMDAGLEPTGVTTALVIVFAMCGIAVRIYLITSVAWAHPAAGIKFERLFPVLLVFDAIWAASPLLASRAIGLGLAFAGVAGLAYLPFAQRTLIRGLYPRTADSA